MRVLKILLLIAMLLFTAPTFAFDDDRRGLLLGFGAGFHSIDIDFIYDGSKFDSQSENGLATSFKIGGGVTNQLAIYYVRNASWYSAPYSDGFLTQDTIYTIGLSGVGASYFLSSSTPSVYVLAAFGIGDISAPFESDVTPDIGGAFMLGGGYEFKRHIMVEATYLSTNIESADDSQLSIESSSLQVTINYVFY